MLPAPPSVVSMVPTWGFENSTTPTTTTANNDCPLTALFLQKKRKTSLATTNPNKGRRVSLQPVVTVHPVLHIKDYTQEEIQQTWYRKKELRSIRSLYRNLLVHHFSIVNSADRNDEDRDDVKSSNLWTTVNENDSLRGLEGKTLEGQGRKFHARQLAKEAVIYEQDRQRELGMNDEDLMADLYFECSEGAQVAAYLLGLRDEQEAIKCFVANTSMPLEPTAGSNESRRRHSNTNRPAKISRFTFSSNHLDFHDHHKSNDENAIPTSPVHAAQKVSNGGGGNTTSSMLSFPNYSCQPWPRRE